MIEFETENGFIIKPKTKELIIKSGILDPLEVYIDIRNLQINNKDARMYDIGMIINQSFNRILLKKGWKLTLGKA